MEISFAGNRYNYKMIVNQLGEKYGFEVKAIDKKARRTSCINTVNLFLSSLDIDLEEVQRLEYSDWIITKRELKRFIQKTNKLFTDKEYLPHFENFLDEDRYEGEWENFEE